MRIFNISKIEAKNIPELETTKSIDFVNNIVPNIKQNHFLSRTSDIVSVKQSYTTDSIYEGYLKRSKTPEEYEGKKINF